MRKNDDYCGAVDNGCIHYVHPPSPTLFKKKGKRKNICKNLTGVIDVTLSL